MLVLNFVQGIPGLHPKKRQSTGRCALFAPICSILLLFTLFDYFLLQFAPLLSFSLHFVSVSLRLAFAFLFAPLSVC
jgi:hypothetical protein